jgi:hypothetical protein
MTRQQEYEGTARYLVWDGPLVKLHDSGFGFGLICRRVSAMIRPKPELTYDTPVDVLSGLVRAELEER